MVFWRSHLVVTGIEKWCRVLHKVPATKQDYTLCCTIRATAAASWALTWGNLVGNWAAAQGSSHPGECMPAWLRSALSEKRSTMISGWDAQGLLFPRFLGPGVVVGCTTETTGKILKQHLLLLQRGDSTDGNESRRTNRNYFISRCSATAPPTGEKCEALKSTLIVSLC